MRMTQENKKTTYFVLSFDFVYLNELFFDGNNNRTRYCTLGWSSMPSNQARGIMGRRTLKTSLLLIAFALHIATRPLIKVGLVVFV